MPSFNITVEDSSPLISYEPANAWKDGSRDDSLISSYSGQSYHATSTQDATATITFKGTGVFIYGARKPDYGLYTIFIDGREVAADTAASGEAQVQTLLGFATGLESGEHTAVLRNTGTGSSLDIDWVDFVGQVGSEGGIMRKEVYDDGDSALSYGPTGSDWSTANGDYMEGTLHFTQSQGASASLAFEGDAVAVYTTVAPDRADITITLDGRTTVVPGGSNGMADSLHTKTLMYYADGLGSSQHEILISSDSQNADTPFVDLDSIVTFSADSPAGQSSQSSSSTKSGMSKGAIIGIAAGSAVAALVVIALGVFFVLRYRRSRKAITTSASHRPSSPESPIGRLPLQTPQMLEAGVTQPGQVWTPPVVHREPSYHKATYKSRSRNNSISEASFQSSSALLMLGAPKPPAFGRSDSSSMLDDSSRVGSLSSFGDMDRGAAPLAVSDDTSRAAAVGVPIMSSQWDDSDLEAPPKKSSRTPFFSSHSRSTSTASPAPVPSTSAPTTPTPATPEPMQPMPLAPRARSRSKTRGDTHSRGSGYESDGAHSSADPRAFPTKPISRPTTPTNSRPTTPVNRRPSRRGHVNSSSAESEAMDTVMRGRHDEIRKKTSARSLARQGSVEPPRHPQAPRQRSRSRTRDQPLPDELLPVASAIARSSSSLSVRSDAEMVSKSRSASRSRPVPKQTSSGTLRPEYGSDVDSPIPRQPRPAAAAAAVPRHLRSAKSSIDMSNDSRSRLDSGELSDISTASDSKRPKRARFELPGSDLKAASDSASPSPSASTSASSLASTRLAPSPMKPEVQSRLQQKRHSRSGSENSFLSVDPMAVHGLPSRVPSPLGRAVSLTRSNSSRIKRKEVPGSHSRNPSEVSVASTAQTTATRDSGLDDATRAGLAARKRSASLGRESDSGPRRSDSASSFGFLAEGYQDRPGSSGRGRTSGRGDPASLSSKREPSVGNAF